jgi:hypothetical protein
MSLNHYYDDLMTKQQALEDLKNGTSILVTLADALSKLPGWSNEEPDIPPSTDDEAYETEEDDKEEALCHTGGGILQAVPFTQNSLSDISELDALSKAFHDRIRDMQSYIDWDDDREDLDTKGDQQDTTTTSYHDKTIEDENLGEEIHVDDLDDMDSIGDLDSLDDVESVRSVESWEMAFVQNDDEHLECEMEIEPLAWVPKILLHPPVEDLERFEVKMEDCF